MPRDRVGAVLIYLPIAELPVNMLMILGMGASVGFLSGMFGIGGGFLLTPLLIFSGIPPAVAVATGTSHIVASSVTGALAYLRRGAVDLKLGIALVAGGMIGTVAGAWIFRVLRDLGQLDLVISLGYVVFLGIVGGVMLAESVRAMSRVRQGKPAMLRKPGQHNWVHRLPFKMRFKRSRIYLSVIPVIAFGAVIGLLGTVLGIGGGFIIVPALIYLLRVPTSVVIGTSLFQITFVMALATVLHAVTNFSVDLVLGLLLMLGGVFGAQLGARIGQRLKGEHIRALLALLVLGVGIRFAIDLVVVPEEPYSLSESIGVPE